MWKEKVSVSHNYNYLTAFLLFLLIYVKIRNLSKLPRMTLMLYGYCVFHSLFKEIEALKRKVKEMEDEDEKLRKMQDEMENSTDLGANKEEIDARSIYVGNVS